MASRHRPRCGVWRVHVFQVVTTNAAGYSLTPPLSVAPDDLNLGDVWELPAFDWVIHVANPTSEPVTVEGWRRDCDCHLVEPMHVTIEPGATVPVRLRLNLSDRGVTSPGDRPVRISLTPQIRGRGHPGGPTWELRGTVKPYVGPVPDRRLVRSELAQPVPNDVFTIRFRVPVRGVSARASDAATYAWCEDAGTGEWRVTVEWPARLPQGEHDVQVTLRPIGPDGGLLPPVRVPIHLTIVPDVRCSPSKVVCTLGGAAEWETEVVRVESLTGRAVTVLGIDDPDPDPTVVTEVRDAEHVQIRVGKSPTGGTRYRQFRVRVRCGGIEYRIPLSVVAP